MHLFAIFNYIGNGTEEATEFCRPVIGIYPIRDLQYDILYDCIALGENIFL